MSQYSHKIPWWWPLLKNIPLIQRARELGHDEHCVASAIFFRNKAVKNSNNENTRKLFDAWASFFDEQIKWKEVKA